MMDSVINLQTKATSLIARKCFNQKHQKSERFQQHLNELEAIASKQLQQYLYIGHKDSVFRLPSCGSVSAKGKREN